jgi:hypothetical protein
MIVFQCSIKMKKSKPGHIDNLSKLFVGHPDGNKEIASQEPVFVIYSFVYLPIIHKPITILCLSLMIQLYCGKEYLNLKSFWIFYISFDFAVMHSWQSMVICLYCFCRLLQLPGVSNSCQCHIPFL